MAVTFACAKFHDYVYGKRITVETDHQPLISFMKKPLHMAPTHLQKMMMRLQCYDIHLVYKKGTTLYLADTLSRAYLPTCDDETTEQDEYEVVTLYPFTDHATETLRTATMEDSHMQSLKDVTIRGWPEEEKSVPTDLKPYF